MNKEKIKLWLDEMEIKNYTINEDLTVDVDGDIRIWYKKLKEIPVQFNKISGYFCCHDNQLTTLKGVPKSVGGNFWCYFNKLTTLKEAPESVGGNFYCFNNQLTTLEGASKSVGGDFLCFNNQLTTLKGAPESVGGNFWCHNNQLKSLEGKPNYVKGKFYIGIATYNKMFRKDKKWSLDDIDEIPAGNIDIKNYIY